MEELVRPRPNRFELNEHQGEEQVDDGSRDTGNSVNLGVTDENLRQTHADLGLIRLSWPSNCHLDDPYLAQLPDSYKITTEKEKVLLWHAENFRKQYHTVYPRRRPLILACDNECSVQKFVSTSIRMSMLPYSDTHTSSGCAAFVSDHLTYEPLQRPLTIPHVLRSPTWVMDNQKGHCFEMATLLVSLLLGQGYNAFVVSGYASREQTLCDTSMNPCPYTPEDDAGKVPPQKTTKTPPKYEVKPPPDFRSKLLTHLEQQEILEQRAKEEEKTAEQMRIIREQEELRPDEFSGRRVHAWVIVLPEAGGVRHEEVSEPFFLEPSSGQCYTLDDHQTHLLYHGVESVWNHRNYWVNLQVTASAQGCAHIRWDLADNQLWAHLLPGEVCNRQGLDQDEQDPKSRILQDKHLDMPTSYVQKIQISSLDYERRFPNGTKTLYYKKTKVDFYAPYVQFSGLTELISIYRDYNYKYLTRLYEKYCNRHDKLVKSIKYLDSDLIIDFYDRGRPDALKEHRYSTICFNTVEDKRILEFYDIVRIDGLLKIELAPLYLIQHFVNRKDCLFYRKVDFSPESAQVTHRGVHQREIRTITEHFNKKQNFPATQEIAIREFKMEKNEIKLEYHYNKNDISRATRTFIKPSNIDGGKLLKFDSKMTYGYNPNVVAQPEKNAHLLDLLEKQLTEEDEVVFDVRDAEKMITDFITARNSEHGLPTLEVSIFDGNRNDEAQAAMAAKEQAERMQVDRELKEEIDYLEPYLIRLGNPETLTAALARQIRHECLRDFKETQVNRANYIWGKYEALREKLTKIQRRLSEEDELDKNEEAKLTEERNSINLEMHALDVRLQRHCNLSSQRYQSVVQKLNQDKRLIAEI